MAKGSQVFAAITMIRARKLSDLLACYTPEEVDLHCEEAFGDLTPELNEAMYEALVRRPRLLNPIHRRRCRRRQNPQNGNHPAALSVFRNWPRFPSPSGISTRYLHTAAL